MAEALGRWLRDEMELPPSAAPSPAALRRLCSGPTAPIWDFVTRHVRNHRNAKKIRGNLRWYGHLQELEGAPAPPRRQGALASLRHELRGLGDAIADAQEAAQRLEAALGAGQRRRWAGLAQGAELRLLGAEPGPDWLRHQGALQGAWPRPGPSRAELSSILASGAEPEVLLSIKALCQAREAELLKPRPPRPAREEPPEARDWLERAQALLIGHSPEAVLWALETLANQGMRELLAGPAPSEEAPPTLRGLVQERWGAVGELWGALPPLLARLQRLRGLLAELGMHLDRERPRAGGTYRLLLTHTILVAFRGALKNPKIPPNPSEPPLKPTPKSELGRLRRRLRGWRRRVLWQQQRLRFLSAATRGRRAGLRPLQGQVVGVARAWLSSAPPPLAGEGRRRRSLVLGAPPEPLPPPCTPPPLRGLGRELGAEQGALLSRAAILRQQLRQGALSARRGRAWPDLGAEPGPAPPPPPEGVAELLPQLRLVGARCRQRIREWPRLQQLVSQWWTQPAQWALATPPGRAPFSHWLRRWCDAAHALGATPAPPEATPIVGLGAGLGEETPPP